MTTTNDAAGATAQPELVITRVLNAPRDLVWKAWSEAEHLGRWWGPKEFTLRVARLDFRPGGVFHYAMQPPDGAEIWAKFVYQEIVAPERIAFTNAFSDAAGNLVRNPWDPTFPLEVLNIFTFSEHEGRTTLTLRASPHGATETEAKTFRTMFESMHQGYNGTFDQLAEIVADLEAQPQGTTA